jgi:hypothetical protein
LALTFDKMSDSHISKGKSQVRVTHSRGRTCIQLLDGWFRVEEGLAGKAGQNDSVPGDWVAAGCHDKSFPHAVADRNAQGERRAFG